jgi:hypothetical protein
MAVSVSDGGSLNLFVLLCWFGLVLGGGLTK